MEARSSTIPRFISRTAIVIAFVAFGLLQLVWPVWAIEQIEGDTAWAFAASVALYLFALTGTVLVVTNLGRKRLEQSLAARRSFSRFFGPVAVLIAGATIAVAILLPMRREIVPAPGGYVIVNRLTGEAHRCWVEESVRAPAAAQLSQMDVRPAGCERLWRDSD